jgi:hypothetical protein
MNSPQRRRGRAERKPESQTARKPDGQKSRLSGCLAFWLLLFYPLRSLRLCGENEKELDDI